MPERPLLLFPSPETASRSKPGGGGGNFHKPSAGRQWDKLSPKFQQLQSAFVGVQVNASGVDPEQVLVIETIGAIENLVSAIKHIDGFEWLGELDEAEISPDTDFYDEKSPEKNLSGRLYWVMSNQHALNQMLSLWEHYKNGNTTIFTRGFTKFRDVFLQLKDIRRWDARDRLIETGVLAAWREDLQDTTLSAMTVTCEIELWFRSDQAKRQTAEFTVSQLVQNVGGKIISQAIIPEISYHALLAELPKQEIQSIINGDLNASLVQCNSVMFFRPSGQITVGKSQPTANLEETGIDETLPMPTGEPIVALFDGLPLENHALLSGRLIIDDPDNWSSGYSAADRLHGTAMASLIVQGDLNDGTSPLPRPLYVRPIMRPNHKAFHTPRPEYVPENILFVDLLHRSVRRLFEGDGNGSPIAKGIKVINLSIGDPTRQFANAMSPAAKLLDWLSVKYNILFVVSAGNHSRSILLGKNLTEFNSLSKNELECEVVRTLYNDLRNRRLLAPAETMNGLSIGALHRDNSNPTSSGASRQDIFVNMLPSPISSFGGGYRRSIKPDLIFDAGRQFYATSLSNTTPVVLTPSIARIAPGNKTATPGTSGQLTAISFSCGTSNATALISRAAGICHDSLIQLISDQPNEIILDGCDTSLLKTMLVHGCSWGDAENKIAAILQLPKKDNEKKAISKWLGYGVPNINRVLECTNQRATVLGFGRLSDGEAHVFKLPLPPSLGQQRIKRRLTVTLGWFSPIAPATQKYRMASMWFEVLNARITQNRKENDWQTVRRGTIQHEIFEGEQAEPITDNDSIQIKVNCRADAGKMTQSVAYGLVVSLEVAEGIDVAIYNEVQSRISQAVSIRSATA